MILMSFDLHKSVKCYIYDAIESMRHRKTPSEVHMILRLKQVDKNSLKVFLDCADNVLMIHKCFIMNIVTFLNWSNGS